VEHRASTKSRHPSRSPASALASLHDIPLLSKSFATVLLHVVFAREKWSADFPLLSVNFPFARYVLSCLFTIYSYNLNQLFLLFNNVYVNRSRQCGYLFIFISSRQYFASWWRVSFITCTDKTLSHARLCLARETPVFSSASYMKVERAPGNATFGTSNEIYYFFRKYNRTMYVSM
jgi:hypothetical protein